MLWLLHLEITLPAVQAGGAAEDPPSSGGAGEDKEAGTITKKGKKLTRAKSIIKFKDAFVS